MMNEQGMNDASKSNIWIKGGDRTSFVLVVGKLLLFVNDFKSYLPFMNCIDVNTDYFEILLTTDFDSLHP